MKAAMLVSLIQTTLELRGNGKTHDSPIRIITQFWSTEGEMRIENDPCAIQLTPELRAKMREVIYANVGENDKARDLWAAIQTALGFHVGEPQ